MQRVGDADGEAEAEESLGEAEGVEVVVGAEEPARNCSPDERCGGQRKIRQVRRREEDCGQPDCGTLIREEARQARHEEVIQKELLVERPENVAGYVLEVAFVKRVQSADLFCYEHAGDGDYDGGGEDPE